MRVDIMKEIGLGLLGFGTVGAGVVKGLAENGRVLSARLGALPVVRRIADIDIERDRGVTVDPAILTRDAASAVNDPAVEVVVELIGGTTVARDLVVQAINLGKPVVTANKALLAEHGSEIFRLAAERNVDIYYGASVGGGIPVIRAVREGLIANRINGIYAILNGTCNYILTRMEDDGMAFDDALAEAQKGGYAEADPSLDIDGHDTAHKAIILAALSYGFMASPDLVPTQGIRGLSSLDIHYARDMGYSIKLLAVIRGSEEDVEVSVHPTLVPLDDLLASVRGVHNAIRVDADMVGETLFYGKGAGCEPTASTVLADIADISRNIMSRSPRRVPSIDAGSSPPAMRPPSNIRTRYYIRLSLADRPGVLANISAALSGRGISIASALQKEDGADGCVPVVFLTHEAQAKDVAEVLQDIRGMETVSGDPVVLRVLGED